eukprot:6624-Pyramimonas_sp.AAC.1
MAGQGSGLRQQLDGLFSHGRRTLTRRIRRGAWAARRRSAIALDHGEPHRHRREGGGSTADARRANAPLR